MIGGAYVRKPLPSGEGLGWGLSFDAAPAGEPPPPAPPLKGRGEAGAAQVVVGARSALFLPYANLGLIVVDEAHEISFKQDDGVRYNARDVAVMRAKFESLPVILASATPALESMHLAETGVYDRIALPDRFGGARLPDIRVVDLRKEPPERGRWLAPPLAGFTTILLLPAALPIA